ncbi:DUF3999 family protein [Orbus mooreae]|uniref:DUF3999 family protein n=1 Tax=Orbus mooreae TaxID=3074107 RepID=UPI00370CFD6D
MIINKYTTVCLSLMISFNALSAEVDSTNNYAFGAELNLTDTESMFSRVELDKQIYTQTQSPKLDDLRVFNRNGQTVPFSLINVYNKKQNKQQFDMVMYPLELDNRSNNSTSNNYSIAIDGQKVNINLDKSDHDSNGYTRSYLLQVPNDIKVTQPIANIKLSFADQAENWQATADIAYSSDLRYWNNTVSDVPIMRLTNNDNSQLSLLDISFPSYSNTKNRNWLITLYSQKPIPELNNVTASTDEATRNNTLYGIDFSLDSSDLQNAIYTLPSPQPVKTMTIELNNSRSVLPVSIFYKTDNKDQNWVKLEDRILRKTDYNDEPTRIEFDGTLIAAVKLTTINSYFDQPPKLIAYRNKVDLVFNSANNAPFILAWGSAQSKAVALPSSTLLSATDSPDSLPLAFIGDPVKLAGEKALITAEKTQSSGFPQWIIWLGLIIGAAVLVALALKLLKEIKKQN